MRLINVPYNLKYRKMGKEGQKIVFGKSTRMIIYLSFYDFHGHRSDNPVELNILIDKDKDRSHIIYIRPLRFSPINFN
jgi:hypothetical protein